MGRRSIRAVLWRPARAALVVALTALLTVVLCSPSARAATPRVTAGPWTLVGWRSVPAGHADQGLATVTTPAGRDRLVLRGNSDVPAALRARGWWHIGDPGSRFGYLVDAFQAAPAKRMKLFVVTAPSGARTHWLHRLAPGERINNSFAAVSPSGRWLVSGEWGTMRRLLVFPMPLLNQAARAGHDLPLAATIRLSRPVRNVQGCSFVTATRLVCATNDTTDALYGVARQLLRVSLSRPLDGRPVTATPTLLGALPQVSGCGPSETEGIDVHGDRLRVVAHEPGVCGGRVDLFTYRLTAQTTRPQTPVLAAEGL
jgi:hypothetical protein